MAEKHLKQLIEEALYHKIYKDEREIIYGQVDGRFHGLELIKKNGLVDSVAVYEYGFCIFKLNADQIQPNHAWLTGYDIIN